MSEQPAENPVPSGDGDTAKRHGDELAEVVERDVTSGPVEESDAPGSR